MFYLVDAEDDLENLELEQKRNLRNCTYLTLFIVLRLGWCEV